MLVCALEGGTDVAVRTENMKDMGNLKSQGAGLGLQQKSSKSSAQLCFSANKRPSLCPLVHTEPFVFLAVVTPKELQALDYAHCVSYRGSMKEINS